MIYLATPAYARKLRQQVISCRLQTASGTCCYYYCPRLVQLVVRQHYAVRIFTLQRSLSLRTLRLDVLLYHCER
jgi:hypothetical protein